MRFSGNNDDRYTYHHFEIKLLIILRHRFFDIQRMNNREEKIRKKNGILVIHRAGRKRKGYQSFHRPV